jgi:HSP20 family protein
MSIIRYKTSEFAPWSSFDRLPSLREFFNTAFQLTGSAPGLSSSWVPALDVYEDADKVTVQLELAGMKKDGFDISLEDDVLVISGSRAAEKREGENFRSERVFGAFSRSVALPSPVKPDQVKALYQDGVLTVTLPKAEEAKPRKIQVELD